jgi:uncharacterized protein (DUF302 family)
LKFNGQKIFEILTVREISKNNRQKTVLKFNGQKIFEILAVSEILKNNRQKFEM